jgi:ubiquinone/menaquinone biosynthesis C-methylase UbiE
MPSQRDPEATAARAVRAFADLAGARVLDIGCGKGELVWDYAAAAGHVVGIDPNGGFLATGLRERPPELGERVLLARARGEALPFRDETFDVAIMAWSL